MKFPVTPKAGMAIGVGGVLLFFVLMSAMVGLNAVLLQTLDGLSKVLPMQ